MVGNNTFAYCANDPVNCVDFSGCYFKYTNPYLGPVLGGAANIGGNASGVATGTGGGGGGFPTPVAALTALELLETIDTIDDIVDGFNGLSHAAEYGIKGYSALKKELADTGLEAHHIVEQRFLKGQNINTSSALSVALTPQEHQMFTNAWRRRFPYGKTSYTDLTPKKIWEAAQDIYMDYPQLLEAVWDTLF